MAVLGLTACGDDDGNDQTSPCEGVGYVVNGNLATGATAGHFVFKEGDQITDGGTDAGTLETAINSATGTVSDIAYIHDSSNANVVDMLAAMGGMKVSGNTQISAAMDHVCYATAQNLAVVDLSMTALSAANLDADDIPAITPVVNQVIADLGAPVISFTLGDKSKTDVTDAVSYAGLTLTTANSSATIVNAQATDFSDIVFNEGEKVVTVVPASGTDLEAPFEYANLADVAVAYEELATGGSTSIPLFVNATFDAALNLGVNTQINIAPLADQFATELARQIYLKDLVDGATSSTDHEIDLSDTSTMPFLGSKLGNGSEAIADGTCTAILGQNNSVTAITCKIN